jgi:hypothetical protein
VFLSLAAAALAGAPEFTLGGQYRLNVFVEDRGSAGTFEGVRPRFRPALEARWEHLATRLELNFAVADSTTTASVRYAQMAVEREGLVASVGLLPIGDRFGDTLFSSDWGFNPVAIELRAKGKVRARAALGRLFDGVSDTAADDDVNLLVLDLDSTGEDGLHGGGSVYGFMAGDGAPSGPFALALAGGRVGVKQPGWKAGAWAVGSYAKHAGVTRLGGAAALHGALTPGKSDLGLLAIYATGSTSPSGPAFLTPMSLLGTHGYWGYTGKLTIQGPTDAGIDDPLNIDGGSYTNATLGRGTLSAQAHADTALAERVTGGLAAGVFTFADAQLVGVDGLGRVTVQLAGPLAADFVVDVAALGDDNPVTGSSGLVVGGYSRLQAQW